MNFYREKTFELSEIETCKDETARRVSEWHMMVQTVAIAIGAAALVIIACVI
jgi:hypothetical protein